MTKEYENSTNPITKDRITKDRIICEAGLELQVAQLISPALEALGYQLVRVRFIKSGEATLQVMVEKPDGSCTIDDCQIVNDHISPLLDTEDLIESHYNLEISSPGMDRPLVRIRDFERNIGNWLKLELLSPIELANKESKTRLKGIIQNVDVDRFTLVTEDLSNISIAFKNIKYAKLIITDDLIRQTLKQEKNRNKQKASNIQEPQIKRNKP